MRYKQLLVFISVCFAAGVPILRKGIFNIKCQYGVYTTMVNYGKTTSTHIYRHLFIEGIGGKKGKKAPVVHQMVANNFVGTGEKMNWTVQKGTAHICSFAGSCIYVYEKSIIWLLLFRLATHNRQKLPCTKIITQRHFIIIFYNDILVLNFMLIHALFYWFTVSAW